MLVYCLLLTFQHKLYVRWYLMILGQNGHYKIEKQNCHFTFWYFNNTCPLLLYHAALNIWPKAKKGTYDRLYPLVSPNNTKHTVYKISFFLHGQSHFERREEHNTYKKNVMKTLILIVFKYITVTNYIWNKNKKRSLNKLEPDWNSKTYKSKY